MPTPLLVRAATLADAPTIARHRAEMFRDIGILADVLYQPLVDASLRYLETSIPSGEYAGWLAAPDARPEEIVAGVGVQIRAVLLRPDPESGTLWTGPDALVVNVFTERSWRRHGLARVLMCHLIDWARTNGIDRLVLHASQEGRPLYEELGFVVTNEMRRTVGKRERREEKGERRSAPLYLLSPFSSLLSRLATPAPTPTPPAVAASD